MEEREVIRLCVGPSDQPGWIQRFECLIGVLARISVPTLSLDVQSYTQPSQVVPSDECIVLFLIGPELEWSRPWRNTIHDVVSKLARGRGLVSGIDRGAWDWELQGAIPAPSKKGRIKDPSDWVEVASQVLIAAEQMAARRQRVRAERAALVVGIAAGAGVGAVAANAAEPKEQSPSLTPMAPIRRSLRVLLDRVAITDADLNRWLIDHFDRAAQEMSDGMDRTQKINLLFKHYSPKDVWNELWWHKLGRMPEAQREPLLRALSREEQVCLAQFLRSHRAD